MTGNIFATDSFAWVGRLDNSTTKELRLVVKDVSTYECILQGWGVVLQYLSENEDKVDDVPEQWWDYYVLARFQFLDWAVAYAMDRTERQVETAIKALQKDDAE